MNTALDLFNNITDAKVFVNVTVSKHIYPVIALHETGIYLFLEDGAITPGIINGTVYDLQRNLGISRAKMNVYSHDPKTDIWEYLDPVSDEISVVDDLPAHVTALTESEMFYLDEVQINVISDKLSFGTFKNAVRKKGEIRTDADGRRFVCKGDHWYPVSDESTEEVFGKTFKFGWLGWFQFHRGKKASGVFYILTFGMFGLGYFSDILSFVTGTARDRDGCYYVPLENRKSALIHLAVSVGLGAVMCFCCIQLWLLLNSGVSSLFVMLMSQ